MHNPLHATSPANTIQCICAVRRAQSSSVEILPNACCAQQHDVSKGPSWCCVVRALSLSASIALCFNLQPEYPVAVLDSSAAALTWFALHHYCRSSTLNRPFLASFNHLPPVIVFFNEADRYPLASGCLSRSFQCPSHRTPLPRFNL